LSDRTIRINKNLSFWISCIISDISHRQLNEKNLRWELALAELRRTQAQLVETEQNGEKD
jgi:hypothetical protein